MKVKPKTENECSEANLLPKGNYPYEITSAVEKTSKSGAEMIELNVKIFVGESFRFVRDWLMDSDRGAYKLRHCCDVAGVLKSYEAGEINALDLVGSTGWAKVGISKGRGDFPDSTSINDYMRAEPGRGVMDAEGDDIPF